MKKNISLAVAALLSLVSLDDVNCIGITQKSQTESSLDLDIDLEALAAVEALTEETRYVGADGNFINLAQTEGHARLKLTQVNKYNKPEDSNLIQTCQKDFDTTGSLAESESGAVTDDVTHCPLNDDGKPH